MTQINYTMKEIQALGTYLLEINKTSEVKQVLAMFNAKTFAEVPNEKHNSFMYELQKLAPNM